jgi:hypothetical protein
MRHWPISSLESKPELCKVAKYKYVINPTHDVVTQNSHIYSCPLIMCRPNTVIVKDSRKSDWVYVVMAVSQY